MTSTSCLEAPITAATEPETINADIVVTPYIEMTPDFLENSQAAASHYLGAFLTNVESFIAQAPELSIRRGYATFDENRHAVEFNLTFSVPASSKIVAAMRARDLLPGSDLDEYDELATSEAHDLVDDAIAEHLGLVAKQSGRLLRFSASDAEWTPKGRPQR